MESQNSYNPEYLNYSKYLPEELADIISEYDADLWLKEYIRGNNIQQSYNTFFEYFLQFMRDDNQEAVSKILKIPEFQNLPMLTFETITLDGSKHQILNSSLKYISRYDNCKMLEIMLEYAKFEQSNPAYTIVTRTLINLALWIGEFHSSKVLKCLVDMIKSQRLILYDAIHEKTMNKCVDYFMKIILKSLIKENDKIETIEKFVEENKLSIDQNCLLEAIPSSVNSTNDMKNDAYMCSYYRYIGNHNIHQDINFLHELLAHAILEDNSPLTWYFLDEIPITLEDESTHDILWDQDLATAFQGGSEINRTVEKLFQDGYFSAERGLSLAANEGNVEYVTYFLKNEPSNRETVLEDVRVMLLEEGIPGWRRVNLETTRQILEG